jgi:hypothetical protein
LAAAVRDGRQPRIDPDLYALLEFRGNERVYQAEVGSFAKRLIGGAWRVEPSAHGLHGYLVELD